MFCPKCGASCGDNERFCPACGTPLEQQAAPTASSAPSASGAGKAGGKIPPKMIGIAAAAVAAIVVIVVLVNVIGGLFSGGGSGSFGSYSANALQFVYADDEYIIYAGTKEVGKADGVYNRQYSLDFSVAAYTDDGTLYVVNSKGVTEVDDDVTTFYLSANGSAIAYVNDDYEIYYYKVSSGKPTRIGEGEDNVNLGLISPDGSAVVFATRDGSDIEGFLSKNGKQGESIGEDLAPIAVSNGGSYVYYVKSKDGTYSLYVMKNGKDEVRLEKEYSLSNSMWLNSDGSQLLYVNNSNTYLSTKGAESTKILSNATYGLAAPDYSASGINRDGIYFTALSDFRGQCYVCGGYDIYYVDSKGDSNKVVSSCTSYVLSSNGKSLIYLKKGDLVKVNDVTNANSKTVELTDEGDIDSFVANADLSVVYYCSDDDLYYQKGTGKAVRVGRDVYRFFMAADNSVCYIVDDDDQLYTSNGKEMTAVKELDDVYIASYIRGVCVFLQNVGGGEYDLYIASGNKPAQVAKDITSIW